MSSSTSPPKGKARAIVLSDSDSDDLSYFTMTRKKKARTARPLSKFPLFRLHRSYKSCLCPAKKLICSSTPSEVPFARKKQHPYVRRGLRRSETSQETASQTDQEKAAAGAYHAPHRCEQVGADDGWTYRACQVSVICLVFLNALIKTQRSEISRAEIC